MLVYICKGGAFNCIIMFIISIFDLFITLLSTNIYDAVRFPCK